MVSEWRDDMLDSRTRIFLTIVIAILLLSSTHSLRHGPIINNYVFSILVIFVIIVYIGWLLGKYIIKK